MKRSNVLRLLSRLSYIPVIVALSAWGCALWMNPDLDYGALFVVTAVLALAAAPLLLVGRWLRWAAHGAERGGEGADVEG